MANRTISGESSALTEDDSRKRTIVKDLVPSENKVVADFAKQLVTTGFLQLAWFSLSKRNGLARTHRCGKR